MNKLREIDLSAVVAQTHAKQTASGYQGYCPCHEDATASLSITLKDQTLLLYCHAGCSFKDIMKAISLSKPVKRVPLKEVKGDKRIVDHYLYKALDETLLYEKLRYEPKDFRIRRWDAVNQAWIWSKAMEGVEKVLFNTPLIPAADTVVICEGEKDANNFNALGLAGYVATTNIEGSSYWGESYTKQVAGKPIIILEDNDAAGVKRSNMLILALKDHCPSIRVVSFKELPAKGDFSDWLETKPTRDEIHAKLNGAQAKKANPWLAIKDASHKDYIEFTKSLPAIKELRREMLSDILFAKSPKGQWTPLNTLEDYVKGHARPYDCFLITTFIEHWAVHNIDELKPRLLIDVPEWDGVDRIIEVCKVLKFEGVTSDCFYDLLCAFGAGIFRRMFDPTAVQPTIILEGGQGLGKDSLIQALFGGLGQYLKDLDISPNREIEALKQLHTGILFNIPEFDRTSKTEISSLKYMLSTPSTDVRLSFGRDAQQRPVRASFIATCNMKDVIADSTGARRFWVFNLTYAGFKMRESDNGIVVGTGEIEKDYPGLFNRPNYKEERLQILAQFYSLYKNGFKPLPENVTLIQKKVGEMVPESLESMIGRDYEQYLKSISPTANLRSAVDNQPLYSTIDIDTTLNSLQKSYGISRRKICGYLKGLGFSEKKTAGTFYRSTSLKQALKLGKSDHSDHTNHIEHTSTISFDE